MKYVKAIIIAFALMACLPVSADYIVVDKQNSRLTLYSDSGKAKVSYPVTLGKNYGQKRFPGDMKTPEGTFYIQSIENSSKWNETHSDWKGPGPGPYGPKFIRLKVPFAYGIGIHGTMRPDLLGSRASEGCVRLSNENVTALSKMVRPGMKVIITKDSSETYVAPKKHSKRANKGYLPARKKSYSGKYCKYGKNRKYGRKHKYGRKRY